MPRGLPRPLPRPTHTTRLKPAYTEVRTLPTEIDHLGIARSPAYHYEPETNGCVEKFIQTLKEQVLWIERFDTHEQLRSAVRGFARRYNEHWLLERHGYRTPIEARQHLLRQAALT
jgi:hypothetical protein